MINSLKLVKMLPRLVLIWAIIPPFLFCRGAKANDAVFVTVKTRENINLRFFLAKTPEASAVLLLFEGGPGMPSFPVQQRSGFMTKSLNLFVKQGFNVVLLQAPDDQRDFRGGMHPDYRETQGHLMDVEKIISWLETHVDLPIWLLGISLGTRSVANVAIKTTKKIKGIVLLSSSTNPPGQTKSLQNFGLELLKIPILTIAHNNDNCPGTPPLGAKEIIEKAVSSKKAVARIFFGGKQVGLHPCRPMMYHTFFGELDVINALSVYALFLISAMMCPSCCSNCCKKED